METVNAKITSTFFGVEDHGILTFYIYLEWPPSAQAVGGFALDQYGGKPDADRPGWAAGLTAMRKILEVVGVQSWEELPGKLVRAKVDSVGSTRTPIIGHIMEDRWFDLGEWAPANRGEHRRDIVSKKKQP